LEKELLYGDLENPYGFELVADALAKEGVETVFTLSGNSLVSLLTEINSRGIKVVGCRSEEGAVLAAAGFAVQSGKVGVALLTGGYVGIAQYGMMQATFGEIPVVIIAGATRSDVDGMRGMQDLDQISIARSAYAKAAYHVAKVERIPQAISWAFTQARSNVPGAAYVEICQDVIKMRAVAAEMEMYVTSSHVVKTLADPAVVKKAADLLKSAKKPAIYVGRMGDASDIHDELKALVDMTGIPVEMCRGNLGPHPLNIGMNGVAADADVVLAVGKANTGVKKDGTGDMHTGKTISIFPDTSDFGRSWPIEIGLPGDVKLVLGQLIEAIKGFEFPDYSSWVRQLFERREQQNAVVEAAAKKHAKDKPINPVYYAQTAIGFMLEKGVNKDAIIGMDGGDCLIFSTAAWMVKGMILAYPGQLLSWFNFIECASAMGLVLPLSLGAAIASPNKTLLIPCMGDGALGYGIAELETLARESISAVIVLSNNGAWGTVYQDQRRIYGRDEKSGSFFVNGLHMEKVCEGFGGLPGYYVENPEDITPALEKAYESATREKKPVIVNILTDPAVYAAPLSNWTLPATEDGEPYTAYGEA
jgi:acetolactate synthase-1/2/3 large subunit